MKKKEPQKDTNHGRETRWHWIRDNTIPKTSLIPEGFIAKDQTDTHLSGKAIHVIGRVNSPKRVEDITKA